jgi:hypothetical protein
MTKNMKPLYLNLGIFTALATIPVHDSFNFFSSSVFHLDDFMVAIFVAAIKELLFFIFYARFLILYFLCQINSLNEKCLQRKFFLDKCTDGGRGVGFSHGL